MTASITWFLPAVQKIVKTASVANINTGRKPSILSENMLLEKYNWNWLFNLHSGSEMVEGFTRFLLCYCSTI